LTLFCLNGGKKHKSINIMQDDKESSSHPKRAVYKPGHWLARDDNGDRQDMQRAPSGREMAREYALELWLGEERRADVFAALRPEPASMKTLVDSLMETVDVKDMKLLEQLAVAWPALVGQDNAKQCKPHAIEKNTLLIEVFFSTWMYILKTPQQKSVISRRISDFTSGKISSVSFVPSGAFRNKKNK